jgi:hypothetical protein
VDLVVDDRIALDAPGDRGGTRPRVEAERLALDLDGTRVRRGWRAGGLVASLLEVRELRAQTVCLVLVRLLEPFADILDLAARDAKLHGSFLGT